MMCANNASEPPFVSLNHLRTLTDNGAYYYVSVLFLYDLCTSFQVRSRCLRRCRPPHRVLTYTLYIYALDPSCLKYQTEPNKNYEDTLLDVYNYATQEKIPYKYVWMDAVSKCGHHHHWLLTQNLFFFSVMTPY